MRGYYGWRGSGKTLSAIRDILKTLKKQPSALVFSNTPIKIPNQNHFYLWETMDELKFLFSVLLTMPYNRLIIVFIDEANLVISSRDWSSLPPFFRSFLAESRKLNVEIMFTTQHPRRVELILRELTEEWYNCSMFWFNLFISRRSEVLDSQGTPIDSFGRSFVFFPRRFYDFYDTYFIVGVGDVKTSESDCPRLVEFLDKTLGRGESAEPVTPTLESPQTRTRVWRGICDFLLKPRSLKKISTPVSVLDDLEGAR